MLLSCTLCVLLLSAAVAAVERPPAAANNRQRWSPFDADRRYGILQPTPVTYTPDEIDRFLFRIMEKLEDMPLPDDPKFEFVRDKNKQIHACEIPEDDDNSMEASANPDDVMETVMRSFADGKCAGRRFGEWYYQVCGNMAVKRSPFTVSYRKGKPKVTTFRAYESLGVLGRDRKVSRHHHSVTEPRYVEQTYYDGAKCSVGGDSRRMQTTVRFECNRRFVSGYVHINEAIEEHPCKYRLQLQSSDFCDNGWLYGFQDQDSIVSCRIYFHPERIQSLMVFLEKFQEEQTAKKRRHAKYMTYPENDAIFQRQLRHPDVRKRMTEWATEFVRRFEKEDAQWGLPAEKDRERRMLDYVMGELAWASMNPDIPYTEEERRARQAEEKEGQDFDYRVLSTMKNFLEGVREGKFRGDQDEDEREYIELLSYSELLRDSELDVLVHQTTSDPRSVFIYFYASWLDYMKELEVEEYMVVRSLLIPPRRKPFSFEIFLLLESLIQSEYADDIRKLYDGFMEMEQKETEPLLLYEGDLDENDLAEIAERFMEVYREAKKGGDTLLFDLLDDDDFEY